MLGRTKKTTSQSYFHKTKRERAFRLFTRANKTFTILSFVVLFATIGTVYIEFGHAEAQYTLVCDQQSSHVCLHLITDGSSLLYSPVDTASFNASTPAEDFSIEYLYGVCGNGLVTSTCPFKVGSGLNTRYLDDSIIQFKYMGGGNYCVGNLGNSFNQSPNAGLQPCNSLNGIDGGPGTMFILNTGRNGTSNYVESRYWSNELASVHLHDQPAWLCNLSNDSLILDGLNSLQSACQWIPENASP